MKVEESLLWFTFLVVFITFTGVTYASEPEQEKKGPESASVILPLIMNEPDSGWMFAVIYLRQNLGPRKDLFQVRLLYTQEKQFGCYTSLKNYLNDGKYLLDTQFTYADWPEDFFGVGNEDPDIIGEKYTSRAKQFSAGFLRKLGDGVYFGPTVSFNRFTVGDKTSGGQLAQGNIAGSNGVDATGVGLHFCQSKLDNDSSPKRGCSYDVAFTFYKNSFGSKQEFSQLNASYSRFFSVGGRGVIGANSRIVLSDGDVPFQMMPSLGNSDIMRGIEPNKFCELNLFAIQGEYRFPIYRNWSGVSFIALGDVADSIKNLSLSTAWGFGVRYALSKDQTMKMRLDIGCGKGTSAVYFGVQEAF